MIFEQASADIVFNKNLKDFKDSIGANYRLMRLLNIPKHITQSIYFAVQPQIQTLQTNNMEF